MTPSPPPLCISVSLHPFIHATPPFPRSYSFSQHPPTLSLRSTTFHPHCAQTNKQNAGVGPCRVAAIVVTTPFTSLAGHWTKTTAFTFLFYLLCFTEQRLAHTQHHTAPFQAPLANKTLSFPLFSPPFDHEKFRCVCVCTNICICTGEGSNRPAIRSGNYCQYCPRSL